MSIYSSFLWMLSFLFLYYLSFFSFPFFFSNASLLMDVVILVFIKLCTMFKAYNSIILKKMSVRPIGRLLWYKWNKICHISKIFEMIMKSKHSCNILCKSTIYSSMVVCQSDRNKIITQNKGQRNLLKHKKESYLYLTYQSRNSIFNIPFLINVQTNGYSIYKVSEILKW